MGKRGPAPKPTPLKVLHGDRKDRINHSAPVPPATDVKRPAWLPAAARDIWDRLAPELVSRRVLTVWDVELFAAFCATAALNRSAFEACFDSRGRPKPTVRGKRGSVKNPAMQLARDTTEKLVSLASRFGLTPSDRSQMQISPGETGGAGAGRLLSG